MEGSDGVRACEAPCPRRAPSYRVVAVEREAADRERADLGRVVGERRREASLERLELVALEGEVARLQRRGVGEGRLMANCASEPKTQQNFHHTTHAQDNG